MAVSAFDLFKIGIGPSSSHTVGPMRAARLFTLRLEHDGHLTATARVQSQLYGSLGATGKGHGSDKAVLLGLAGHEPDSVDIEAIPALLDGMRKVRRLRLNGGHEVAFDEAADLIFHRRETLPFHANGMRFIAFDAAGRELANRCYYSVGGGFVVSDEVAADGTRQKVIAPDTTVLAHPFHSGDDLLRLSIDTGLSIAKLMRRQRTPLAQRRRDRRRPAAHLGRDAGLRGTRLQDRRRAAGWLQGATARRTLVSRPDGQPRGSAARPVAGDRLGQPVCARRQRGERRRRARRDRADQRRGRHHSRGAALLHAFRPRQRTITA